MGGTCSTYGGEWTFIQVLVNKPKGKKHLEDVGVHKIILKLTLKIRFLVVGYINFI
jgi:hypothetical protein